MGVFVKMTIFTETMYVDMRTMFMNAATTLSRGARKGCLPEGLK